METRNWKGRGRVWTKIEGATAVKLVAPSNWTVKFLAFSIPSGDATAVRHAAPFKQTRKGFELRDSIWRSSLPLSLLRPLN